MGQELKKALQVIQKECKKHSGCSSCPLGTVKVNDVGLLVSSCRLANTVPEKFPEDWVSSIEEEAE